MKISKTKTILSVALVGIFFIATKSLAFFGGWDNGMFLIEDFGLPNANPENIIINLLEWLLLIFTILAVISFVIAGIMFLMAGSNKEMYERAKNAVTYSIIGVTVGIIGYIVIRFIDEALNANL